MIKLCNISVVYIFEVWKLVKRYVSKQIRCVKFGLQFNSIKSFKYNCKEDLYTRLIKEC